MNLKPALFLFFLFLSFHGFAQEKVIPLNDNADIIAARLQKQTQPVSHKKRKLITVGIPFFDDFSHSYISPGGLWLDSSAYINQRFGFKPPSTGVATLDGLNSFGTPYNPGTSSRDGQPCDTLTSVYINLSNFQEKDSLYLSFFYQAGGYGDLPERDEGDSLILQFKPDSFKSGNAWNDSSWIKVWGTDSGPANRFKLIMIPLKLKTDTNYFHSKFQFRFVNFSNGSGNLDHWNIDYVLLDRGRTRNDSAFNDVANYQPSGSILKKYYSMPWDQFLNSQSTNLRDSIRIFSKNNYNEVRNSRFGYIIENTLNNQVLGTQFNTQGQNLRAFGDTIFQLKTILNTGSVIPVNDLVRLRVKTAVINDQSFVRENDTSVHYQIFSNYLAYDDGSAEAGYGLTNITQGKVAIQYTINAPDTIYGFIIHFNQSGELVSGNTLTLALWDKITVNGNYEFDQPIATVQYVHPAYFDQYNRLAYFPLDTPKRVNNEFFIGWIQTKDFYANVGYDKNYSLISGGGPNNNIFIDVNGKWRSSQVTGAPIFRPILGKAGYVSSIKNSCTEPHILVYPNPTTGRFYIDLSEDECQVSIFDATGRLISSEKCRNRAELELINQPKGVYVVKIESLENHQVLFRKLVRY